MEQLNIAEQFSISPYGRTADDGPNNGARFRDELLLPALEKTDGEVEVVLNGSAGYSWTFLDEAFGELARSKKYSCKDLERRLKIVANRKYKVYENIIWKLIKQSSHE